MGKIPKLKIYLDTSVYNRPFDDQTQIRIRLETESFLTIFEEIIKEKFFLVISSVLIYENSLNPFAERKEKVNMYLSYGKQRQPLNYKIEKRATTLTKMGFASIDALHIAVAEYANCDYFITCDDEILRIFNKFQH